MFQFYGILSEKSISIMMKREKSFYYTICILEIIVALCISITMIILNIDGFQEIFTSIVFIFLLMYILLNIKPYKFAIRNVIIDIKNNIITTEIERNDDLEKKSKTRQLSKIKKIIDCGNCYCIVFMRKPSFTIVCQKDLLKIGTIDNFETYFKNKIIRKV